MRKLLFWLIIILLVGGSIGLAMKQDSGYVLIAFQGVTLEMSLWVLVGLIISLYIAINLLLKMGFGRCHTQMTHCPN